MEKIENKGKNKSFIKVIESINDDRIGAYTAQCSYYTILSFIPFLILLLTMIQYTNIDQQTLFEAISKIVPESMNDFVIGIVREVYSKSVETISISAIFIILAAGKGLLALTQGLHEVFGIKDRKSNSFLYLKLKSILQTIIFIIIIVIGLVALVFSNSLTSIVQNQLGNVEKLNVFASIFKEVIFIFVTFLIFVLLYKFMPHHKVTFKSQVPGAIFGAIGLNIISFVFSIYLDVFKGFSIMYGSLTTLMLIMMWTYSCFYAVFLGAKINNLLSKNDKNY